MIMIASVVLLTCFFIGGLVLTLVVIALLLRKHNSKKIGNASALTKTRKAYCATCVHCREHCNETSGAWNTCTATWEWVSSDYNRRKRYTGACEERNKNNDCQLYQPNIFKSWRTK